MLRRLFRRRRDPWTDPTLPRQCTATHPLWGTECVKDEHADAQHCDYLGTLWVTRLSPDAQALWDAAVAEEEAIQRAREWRP